MKIAIGRAYNGLHKIYKKELTKLNVASFYFNIDQPNWVKIEKQQPNAYLWHADDKGINYNCLYEKIYFIEHILNKPILPDIKMYFAQGDKIKQWQVLNYLKVKTPKTYISHKKNEVLKILKKIKYPLVIKNPYGYGGYQVIKVDNLKTARSRVEQLFKQRLVDKNNLAWPPIFYAQEFITTDKDLRVVTLGKQVYCAYWRKNKTRQWKHNLEQGAEIDYRNLPQAALRLCQNLSRQLKFHWMAYDLFITADEQILVNEYSCNFADKGIRQAGLNVRQAQIQYFKKYLI